jgi:hypothetical protein
MNQPNCSQTSLQSDILTSFTGGLQQDFTSFSSYRGLQPLLAACSRTSNSLTSPASPATEVLNLSWQPAARHPTFQLHQLLQLQRSSTPPGSLQQDVQLFNFTCFSSYIGLEPLLAACSKTSNFSTSPASPGRHQQGPFLCLWTIWWKKVPGEVRWSWSPEEEVLLVSCCAGTGEAGEVEELDVLL